MKWKYVTLDKLGSISRGKSKYRPRNDATLFGGDYPFFQTADVKNAGLFLTDYSETYNQKGLEQSKLWKAGTLCITIAANIADTAILGIDACFPDSIMGFIPYEGISDVKFVKYAFDILQRECQTISQGTAQDNLSWKKLSSIKFPAPPYNIQKKIASILSAYDSLIETNRKQIKLLEEAAQRLYKEWFVDFRFPGWERAEFVDGVPKGWRRGELFEIADIVMGQSPKSIFYNQDKNGLPFHQGVGSYGKRFVIDEVYSTSYTRIAESNSILFSVRAPVGRLNITKNRIVIGRGLCAMNHRTNLQSYLFYMLKERFFKEDMIGNGSIYASVSKEELLKQSILLPSNEITSRFDEIASSIDNQIKICDSQIERLSEARDRLLPKLMSGEIEV